MAKGQYLSSYQRGIVKRFYQHRDTIVVTRLQELVSDLALAEGKAADRHWKRAADTLARVETDPPLDAAQIDAIVSRRDVKAFAELVGALSA